MSDEDWGNPMLYLPHVVCQDILNSGAVPSGLCSLFDDDASVENEVTSRRIQFWTVFPGCSSQRR